MAANALQSQTSTTGLDTGLLQVYLQILEDLEDKCCLCLCVCVCVCVCVHVVSDALRSRRSNGQLVFALTAGAEQEEANR